MAEGVVAGVIHFEGAEAIGPDLDALHLFHAMGLRSLGPVWSRPTVFGHGVPFRSRLNITALHTFPPSVQRIIIRVTTTNT